MTNQVDRNPSRGTDSWSRNAPPFMESKVHTSFQKPFPGLSPDPEKFSYRLLNIKTSG